MKKLIQAGAGCGKTTALLQVAADLPRHQTNICLAFNASIAGELQQRLPYWVKGLTFHKFCKDTLAETKFRLAPRKANDIAKKRDLSFAAINAVDWLKSQCREWSEVEFERVLSDLSAFEADPAEIRNLFHESVQDEKKVDFNDLLLYALRDDVTFPKIHTLLVDEGQDLSPVQHALIRKWQPENLIVVGDRYQSIYGFRGAEPGGLDKLKREYEMEEETLPETFRCPPHIVEEANRVLAASYCQPADFKLRTSLCANGTRTRMAGYPPTFPEGAFILCRNNAPLLRLAVRMWKRGERFAFQASELKWQLERLIRPREGEDKLNVAARLRAEEAFWLGKTKSKTKAQAIRDRYEAAHVILEEASDLSDAKAAVNAVFAHPDADKTLSTIHRQKGAEAEDVYILNSDLIPSPFAETELELQQERNLHYVAVTRSKKNLTYITI